MSGEPLPKDSIESIIGQSAVEQAAGGETISQDDMRAMADALQLLTADFGAWKGYKAASTKYVEEFTKEIVWHRLIRLWVAIACAVIVTILAATLVYAVFHADTLFSKGHEHSLTALIVGCITGSVIVTIALVKGAFSNVADRNAGLPMPEHMKEIVEAAKNIVGGMGKQ
jgi:hypothetical protein